MLIKLLGQFLILVCISHFCFAEQTSFVSQKIDKHIGKYVEEEAFKGVVLVAKEGKVIFKSAYGNADESNKIPNTWITRS